jgi:HlyD family secretion protein
MDLTIFRKVSLERLSSPEQLDQVFSVMAPKEWIALLALSLLLGTGVVWGFKGSIPTKVTGQGVVIRHGGVVNIVSPGSGLILELRVKSGDRIARNQVIAKLSQPGLEEKIKLTREALVQAQQERERSKKSHADSSRVQIEALARQRDAAEQQIADLQAQSKLLEEQIPVEEQLLAKGLITRQQPIATRQKLAGMMSQITAVSAQIKQLDAQQFSAENQPREAEAGMKGNQTDLERNLASLEKELSMSSNVVSPYAGQVVELKVYRGGAVGEGSPVASVQSDVASLEVLFYLNSAQAKDVRPGMEAQVSPGTIKREEYGFMKGRVSYVAEYPATGTAVMRNLENESLAQSLTASGPVTEVHIQLEPADTPSGFQWSSRQGPPLQISSGTMCTAMIVTREQPPASLVFPILKEKLGLS